MPFGAFLPKAYHFFDFFAQHASPCVEGTRLLLHILDDVRKAESIAQEVKEVGHAGDKITHHNMRASGQAIQGAGAAAVHCPRPTHTLAQVATLGALIAALLQRNF